MRVQHQPNRFIGAVVAAAAMIGTTLGPVTVHAEPQGHLQTVEPIGFFYGTFHEPPNLVLLAGGRAEEFCPADPGAAPGRVFLRRSGVVDIKVNDQHQPIHLYEADQDAPVWLGLICDGAIPVPEPMASGTAGLKLRVSVVSDEVVEVFNSVNGTVSSDDGTVYKVRASADLVLENDVPVGDPADFVDLEVKRIKR
jgi:hypothetical protein